MGCPGTPRSPIPRRRSQSLRILPHCGHCVLYKGDQHPPQAQGPCIPLSLPGMGQRQGHSSSSTCGWATLEPPWSWWEAVKQPLATHTCCGAEMLQPQSTTKYMTSGFLWGTPFPITANLEVAGAAVKREDGPASLSNRRAARQPQPPSAASHHHKVIGARQVSRANAPDCCRYPIPALES